VVTQMLVLLPVCDPACRPPSMPTGPVRKPAGSRITAENTAGKLDIDIPPQGLGGSNIGTGLFALAWNAFVAFWTVRRRLHGCRCRLCRHDRKCSGVQVHYFFLFIHAAMWTAPACQHALAVVRCPGAS
jgi:hypothetical protein